MIIFLFLVFSVGIPILIGKFLKSYSALLFYCVLHFVIFTIYFSSDIPTHPHNPIDDIPSTLISIIISTPAIISSLIMVLVIYFNSKNDKVS